MLPYATTRIAISQLEQLQQVRLSWTTLSRNLLKCAPAAAAGAATLQCSIVSSCCQLPEASTVHSMYYEKHTIVMSRLLTGKRSLHCATSPDRLTGHQTRPSAGLQGRCSTLPATVKLYSLLYSNSFSNSIKCGRYCWWAVFLGMEWLWVTRTLVLAQCYPDAQCHSLAIASTKHQLQRQCLPPLPPITYGSYG